MNLISPIAIEDTTTSNGGFVDLDNLKTIKLAYLTSFINDNWGVLSLNGLSKITPDIAYILSKHRGILSLNGITSLDYESALYLAKHQGTLFLKGIKTMNDAVVGLFANTNETIILGLESVNAEVAKILAHPHGVIVYSAKILEKVRKLIERT